ncbi:MAG: membrane protein insertion efficiency factor YidD [Bacteroidota bacterium]
MKHLFIGIVRLYQLIISPHLQDSCRYYPTCSHYAIEALRKHGALRGSWLALTRLLRCHPWAEGGIDPVPDPHHGHKCDHDHHGQESEDAGSLQHHYRQFTPN